MESKFVLYSNNIERISEIDVDAIIRINMAWEDCREKVVEAITGTTKDIFLDYPHKRSKFPLPKVNLQEAIDIANEFNIRVKYFAVSNCEAYDFVLEIREKLKKDILLVPKIESKAGIENFIGICAAAKTNLIMLDREDLTRSLNDNQDEVMGLVDLLYSKADKYNIDVLGLQGVVFSKKNKGDDSSITKE